MAIDTELEQDTADEPMESEAPEEADDDQDTGDDQQDDNDQGANRSLAQRGPIKLPGIRPTFTFMAAIIPENLSWDGWKKSWASVSGISETSKWWKGDLMRFAMEGERYGQRYSQFLDAENYGSLKNLMSICGKFPPEARHEGLTFTHHVAAAPLMPDHAEEAEEILSTAAKEGWSVADVRAAVREYLEGPPQEGDDEITVMAKAVPVQSAESIGIAGIPLADIESGTEYYECGISTCEDVGFLEAVSHCFDCGAHFSADEDECPYCPEMAAGDAPTATEGPSEAVAGTVITPEDRQIPDDEDDEQDAPTQVSVVRLINLSSLLTTLDPVATARDTVTIGPVGAKQLVALHAWLTQVVAALPNQSGGKPFSPVPKPAGKKRGRKSNKEKAAVAANETED